MNVLKAMEDGTYDAMQEKKDLYVEKNDGFASFLYFIFGLALLASIAGTCYYLMNIPKYDVAVYVKDTVKEHNKEFLHYMYYIYNGSMFFLPYIALVWLIKLRKDQKVVKAVWGVLTLIAIVTNSFIIINVSNILIKNKIVEPTPFIKEVSIPFVWEENNNA